MKTPLLILVSIVGFLVGCENKISNEGVVLVIDTYTPDKSTGAYPKGKFDPTPVGIYIDNEFIGTTPVKFTEKDLAERALPSFKRIDTENGHWDTWDLGKDSTLVIRHEHKKSEQKVLDFRSSGESSAVLKKFSGYTNGKNSEGIHTMLITFPEKSA